ncbi:MAG: Hsp20/alpha crystallin family protein [Desulfobulbaceae bacterium]|nr:MAG: Hsp20/alpha crystallin family protein [Desulfobulbaceae bacterium]
MENKDIAQRDQTGIETTSASRSVMPLVDIYESDDEILLHAEMPGVKKDDVTINIDNGNLTLSGVSSVHSDGSADWEEFNNVEYTRAFSVPQTIDVEKVKAELKDGILALHLPKSEAAKPRTIEITSH